MIGQRVPKAYSVDRDTMFAVGNDLIRGDGLRVVSAWRHLPTLERRFLQTVTKTSYVQLCERVAADVGHDVAQAGHNVKWSYQPFFKLYRACGQDHWPIQALVLLLEYAGEPRSLAEEVWQRAIERYERVRLAAMLA